MSKVVSPGYGSQRRTFARIVTDGSDSVGPIALDTEGTIDWAFVGAITSSTHPYNSAGAANPPRKRDGDGDLYRNMGWKGKGKAWDQFDQATSRTMTVSAANNAAGGAISSTAATGYFANGANEVLECGPEFYIPAHRELRRLKIYTVGFQAYITCRARILNGELADGKDLIETSEYTSTHDLHQWTIDYASHVGGYLYVEVVVTTMLTVNAHIKLQGMSIAPAP